MDFVGAPNVTVEFDGAPNVTVEFDGAPNVTVELDGAPNVTVELDGAPNVTCDDEEPNIEVAAELLNAAPGLVNPANKSFLGAPSNSAVQDIHSAALVSLYTMQDLHCFLLVFVFFQLGFFLNSSTDSFLEAEFSSLLEPEPLDVSASAATATIAGVPAAETDDSTCFQAATSLDEGNWNEPSNLSAECLGSDKMASNLTTLGNTIGAVDRDNGGAEDANGCDDGEAFGGDESDNSSGCCFLICFQDSTSSEEGK